MSPPAGGGAVSAGGRRNQRRGNRGTHSNFRAAQYKREQFRERFNRYRDQRRGVVDVTARNHERWAMEEEELCIDSTIKRAEEQALENRIKHYVVPELGALPTIRPDDVWRIMYNQVNCLGRFPTNNRKAAKIADLINEYEVDAALFCEVGIDWKFGHSRPQLRTYFDPLLDRECRTTTACNEHTPHISRAQQGGTGILLTHSLIEYARHCEEDTRRLGRWTSWVLSHNPHHRTRLVVAYCPGKTKPKGPKTVYRQHMNLIHSLGLDTTPYKLFVDDLVSQLRRWRRAGDRIVLCMDANEHVVNGPLAQRLRSDDIGLNEIGHDYWPSEYEPHTHIDGSQPIDGIFVTADLDVSNFLALSFHESVGDHRTMIVEITARSLIGKYQGAIVRPSSRRLTLRQHGAVQSYIQSLLKQTETHRIEQRLSDLRKAVRSSNRDLSKELRMKCMNIHNQIGQMRLHAERTCRKILRPALEFSPPIQYWYDRAHAYKMLLRIKEKEMSQIDKSRVIRMAHRKGIKHPRTLTAEQCRDGLAACKLRQAHLRKLAPGLRQQFIGEQLNSAQQRGDVTREKAIKERMMIERNRRLWKQIKRATNPQVGRACMEVQVSMDGRQMRYHSKASVEQAIQKECLERFHLGHSAPIASTLLGYELQYLGNRDIAYAILSGKYVPPIYLDPATKMIIKEIGKLGSTICTGESKPYLITGGDYITYWSRMNEHTSSSPSGIHIAHYKASAQNTQLADLFANQMNLIIESGVHPLRWGSALQVMLEKVAGVCLVDKLRSIQLYEADLNWYMKFIFNDAALEKLTSTGLLPEEHFSRKGSTAEDACLDKTLTLDISRQSRLPMALISVDAAQCYDRVQPILMSLVWLALIENFHVVILLLTVLQQMKIFTRTGFGDSTSFFGGPDCEPSLCGLGQGSKAAPASWIQLSSMIVNAYKSEGLASVLKDAITGEEISSVGCLFVDDTDLYAIRHDIRVIIQVVRYAQACVNLWSALLAATGGNIKASKSFWYLIAYVCCNGQWEYVTKRTTPADLTLQLSGFTHHLTRKEYTEAEKTLGVFHSPEGGHRAHLRYLSDRGDKWVNNMKNANLSSTLIWKSYIHQYWPGVRYGLGTLTNTSEDLLQCTQKMEVELLPLLGVNRNITKGWRTLPFAFGGVGLLHLPIEQMTLRTHLFLQHYNAPSVIGKKLRCSMHILQLQIGTNRNPLQLNYTDWGFLAPHSWITCFWESLSKYPWFEMFMDTKEIPFPRANDAVIMDLLRRHTQDHDRLLRLNRCRVHLKLLFLSDMTLADGTIVDPVITSTAPRPRRSCFSFPPEEPTRLDWIEWSSAWKSLLGRHNKLHTPLGSRLHDSHIQWQWWYDPNDDILLEEVSQDEYLVYTRDLSRRTTRLSRTYRHSSSTNNLPSASICASCTRVRFGDSTTTLGTVISLTCTGSRYIPQQADCPTFWDDLLSLGGEWMWNCLRIPDDSLRCIATALINGTLIWVTDGSHDSRRAPNVSGVGWVVYDTESRQQWECSFVEYSPDATSYRAELLGLYSIHVFIGALISHFGLLPKNEINIRCDNKMALRQSSKRNNRVRSSTVCADILRLLKRYHATNNFPFHYAHVKAHMDDILEWENLTIEQQLNVRCDQLAKSAVATAIQRMLDGVPDTLSTTQFLPGKQCAVLIDGIKQTSDPGDAMRLARGRAAAKIFLTSKKGWTSNQFDEVDWNSLHDTLSRKPPGYRIWLTKQHSNFCASGVQMRRWFQSDNDCCPNCLTPGERADHLCICPNSERTQLLVDGTNELEKWMERTDNTYHEICYLVPKYILCRGTVQFADLGPMSPCMMEVAISQDKIGWRNFMEGRVSKRFIVLQRAHICTSETRVTAKSWMRTFISHILQITHSQWLFRNFTLHDRSRGFLTTKDKAHTAAMIEALMHTRPSTIPSESRFLLEFDTERLLQSGTDTQHYWIAAVEAAVASTSPPRGPTSVAAVFRGGTQSLRSALGVNRIIRQIREEAKVRVLAQGWIQNESSLTYSSSINRRPIHDASCLHHGSRKKHKPD